MTNDQKDRHVLAAAVRCGAHAILTRNVKHLPTAPVTPYGIDLLTDEFLVQQLLVNPALLLKRLGEQADARSVSTSNLLSSLAGMHRNSVL